jgi:hypothetical protein
LPIIDERVLSNAGPRQCAPAQNDQDHQAKNGIPHVEPLFMTAATDARDRSTAPWQIDMSLSKAKEFKLI